MKQPCHIPQQLLLLPKKNDLTYDPIGNLQQFGRFDRVAASGAKRWTFNYVSSGESFTGMTNLSTIVFVFEMTNLAAEEIRQQVEQYINATRNL